MDGMVHGSAGGRDTLLAWLRVHCNPRFYRRPRSWWPVATLVGIAILTLFLYTWALSRNGMANSYYSAAVKSATISWKAFFFGSLDPGSFITVDKPPVSLWVQALSARLFGFSSWSILLPQALAGVASVLVLHRMVRRWAGEIPALIASVAFALTPVAVVMFRYNNPDALLVLLLLLAAWAVWSARESGSTWKLVAAGALLGFAFLTKMLEAVTVVPAVATVYLSSGPRRLRRRALQLVAALGAFIVCAGWWIAIVELWPKSTRPYIGGSNNNSIIELIFSRSGGYGGTSSGVNFLSGSPGWLRLFNHQLGGQISWLLPLALTGLVVGLWVTRPASRTDKKRAGYRLWGLWTVVMMAIFNYVTGTFHSYYVVIMAPGIAALAGAGSVDLWRVSRGHRWLAWLLPAVVLGSALWSAVLLGRISGYAPGLATVVIVLGSAGAIALFAATFIRSRERILTYGAVAVAVIALSAGPLAYAVSTIGRTVSGNQATAGPSTTWSNDEGSGASTDGSTITVETSGDFLVDKSLLAYLEDHRASTKYLVAVEGSSSAVPIILATGDPVMAIGGYRQRDPVPTVAQFAAMVASDQVHYALIEGGQSTSGESTSTTVGSPATASDTAGEVVQWIIENGTIVDSADYEGSTSQGVLYYLP